MSGSENAVSLSVTRHGQLRTELADNSTTEAESRFSDRIRKSVPQKLGKTTFGLIAKFGKGSRVTIDTNQSGLMKLIKNSPLDIQIKPVNPKVNQPWIFIGRTDAEVEAPILWLPDAKS